MRKMYRYLLLFHHCSLLIQILPCCWLTLAQIIWQVPIANSFTTQIQTTTILQTFVFLISMFCHTYFLHSLFYKNITAIDIIGYQKRFFDPTLCFPLVFNLKSHFNIPSTTLKTSVFLMHRLTHLASDEFENKYQLY